MLKLRKLTKALVVGGIVASAGVANTASATAFLFDTANIPGATAPFHSFTADEINITSLGAAAIAVTDVDGNGLITPAFADTFAETGTVVGIGFKLGGGVLVPVVTGLGIDYELFATYTLFGAVGLVGPNIVAPFVTASATIFYDESVDGVLSVGSIAIGSLAIPPGAGDCTLTGASSFADGACELTGGFSAVAGGGTGIWSVGGVNLASIPAAMNLDINIDSVGPPAAVAALPGITAGGVTMFTADHDGSARILVPEPGTLALLGAALLGIVGLRRRSA
jgi:hypothetical protein